MSIARHGRCTFCDHVIFGLSVARHDHTERSGKVIKPKDVLDAKALAKDRVTLKITKPLESADFDIWGAAERTNYTLGRAIPQNVRRAVRAKYAEPAVEGEKPRRITSTRLTDHDALVHAYATSPPVSTLSIHIGNKKMTASNKCASAASRQC